LLRKTRDNHYNKFGRYPVCVAQLTHSGRFSKPDGVPAPVYPVKNPHLDEKPVDCRDFPVITDAELDAMQNDFVAAAKLAEECGFDGIDIKSCHKYIVSELLGAVTRPGKYGGEFRNRIRFFVEVLEKVKTILKPETLLCTRMNFCDQMPYPYGFGMAKVGMDPDYAEVVELVRVLRKAGVDLINATMGSPYYNPHVNRPFDRGAYIPDEHPLAGVARLIEGIGEVQQAVPDMPIVSTGYSWLRDYAPYAAAGALADKKATLVGFGRQAFAYPDYVADLLANGRVEREKCCIACSQCASLLRGSLPAGCIARDNAVYGPIYAKLNK